MEYNLKVMEGVLNYGIVEKQEETKMKAERM